MNRRLVPFGAVAGALFLPVAAQGHVSLHPNVVPAGASATLVIRVPNEQVNTTISKVAVQMPPGFVDVSAAPPPGWSFSVRTKKLAIPIKTDEGQIDTEVTEIEFSGGKTPPGQFVQLPILTALPDAAAGKVLTFKTVEYYSNGKQSAWIGPPTADLPAPTIDITAKGGDIRDVAGGEAGPPATVPPLGGTAATAPKAKATSKGASKGLGIAALAVGLVALGLAGAGLARKR